MGAAPALLISALSAKTVADWVSGEGGIYRQEDTKHVESSRVSYCRIDPVAHRRASGRARAHPDRAAVAAVVLRSFTLSGAAAAPPASAAACSTGNCAPLGVTYARAVVLVLHGHEGLLPGGHALRRRMAAGGAEKSSAAAFKMRRESRSLSAFCTHARTHVRVTTGASSVPDSASGSTCIASGGASSGNSVSVSTPTESCGRNPPDWCSHSFA